jgi:hypothetical protein
LFKLFLMVETPDIGVYPLGFDLIDTSP